MDHSAVIFRFVLFWERRQGMAFREVLVTQVREVLRAWLGGQGKRPAAARAGVDVKTAQRYIAAAWESLVPVAGDIRGWVQQDLTRVKIGELLERRGVAVPYRTLARFAAEEC